MYVYVPAVGKVRATLVPELFPGMSAGAPGTASKNTLCATVPKAKVTVPPGRMLAGDGLNATLGLSSLDLALIVAELEVEVGADPFAKLVSITSVRSVNDLVGAYRKALFPETNDSGQDHDLAVAVRRAQMRQARKAQK